MSNYYQRRLSRRAKNVSNVTGFDWKTCKDIARSRVLYEAIKICIKIEQENLYR